MQYFFYNVVEPGTTYRYGRPAGATDDAKWAKALRENPDPDTWDKPFVGVEGVLT